MSSEATNQHSGFGRIFRRFVLLVIVPVVAIVIAGSLYLRGGRFVSSENAYVKTNIIAVSADVSGRTLPGIATNNQTVEPGDLLFRIDPTEYQLLVAEALAAMELVRTEVETLRAEHQEVLVSISEARERIAYYQRQYQRYQSLKTEGIGSAQAADDALFNLKSAQQRVKVLNEKSTRMLTAFNGDATLPVEQHPAHIQASVRYQQAITQQQKTEVTAPVAGIVSNNNLQAGEYITAGKPVFSLIESQPVWIEANLKETQLTHLREGQRAVVSVDAYPDVEWSATVATIAPATGAEFSLLPPQNATGNWVKVVQRIPVSLDIEREDDHPLLRAGMTVSVRIDTQHKRQIPPMFQPLLAWMPVEWWRGNRMGALQAAELSSASDRVVVASFASTPVDAAVESQTQPKPVIVEADTSVRHSKGETVPVVAALPPRVTRPVPEGGASASSIPVQPASPVRDALTRDGSLEMLDEDWIADLPGHLFTLQVGTSTNRDKLIEFAAEFARDTPMLLYLHRYNDVDEPIFALAHGLYRSRETATAALARLPIATARFKPWIRRISDVQENLAIN